MTKHLSQFLHPRHTVVGVLSLASHAAWTPNTDVFETADALVVRMELAGVTREDLEITLDERLLVVRGRRQEPCRRGHCTFRQMEIDYGYFERRILIPRPIDPNRARAQLQNGFLHVELPKSPARARATVTVVIQQLD